MSCGLSNNDCDGGSFIFKSCLATSCCTKSWLTTKSSLTTSSGTSVACVSSCNFTHIDDNHETSIDVPVYSINGYHTSCHLKHSLLRWDCSCSFNEVIVGHSSSS